MQFLHNSGGGAGLIQLQGSFTQQEHLCLVFEMLSGSIVDRILAAAELDAAAKVDLLQGSALDMLVGHLGHCPDKCLLPNLCAC